MDIGVALQQFFKILRGRDVKVLSFLIDDNYMNIGVTLQ